MYLNETCTHTIQTPLGFFSIVASEDFILSTNFSYKKISSSNPTPLLKEASKQCQAYFAGSLRRFDLPQAPHGTEFQLRCWAILQTIPYAQTLSYSEQAIQIKSPKASRAVGGANGRNPIPLIIPCHRVIGKNGDLTGFSGGLKIKKFLLQHEQKYRH
jgi:methylated-DNA-[protein]-cysteine S-methyltransferase